VSEGLKIFFKDLFFALKPALSWAAEPSRADMTAETGFKLASLG